MHNGTTEFHAIQFHVWIMRESTKNYNIHFVTNIRELDSKSLIPKY